MILDIHSYSYRYQKAQFCLWNDIHEEIMTSIMNICVCTICMKSNGKTSDVVSWHF